jgi:L-alanine-DL-glutamate epimerase-like enolase superfamily enzyme
MNVHGEIFTIRLPRPFRIAHGVSHIRETVLVRVSDDGFTGWGEGALPPYYPSRAEACLEWLRDIEAEADSSAVLPPVPADAAAARVALEMARFDLAARRAGLPLGEFLGLEARETVSVARTLSIPQNIAELAEMLADGRAQGSRLFKLKMGGDVGWDIDCARQAVRLAPDCRFMADVNAGWRIGEAVEALPLLAKLGFVLVEQPVGVEWEHWRELREYTPRTPLLIADESFQDAGDLPAATELADGVNVKILKAGGVAAAKDLLTEARRRGLQTMIGVMVETGIARSAAAQLASLADWVDIDPPDAIPTEPLCGFAIEGDKLRLHEGAGLALSAVTAGDRAG